VHSKLIESWTVCRWLPGSNPVVDDLASPESLASDLAAYITALRRVDPDGAPPSGRGVPLATRTSRPERPSPRRTAHRRRRGDPGMEDALRIPAWSGLPAWTHADLSPGNLLVRDGCLTAVIDWRTAGVSDPTVDLIIAWDLLPASSRPAFRKALAVDDGGGGGGGGSG
jgi:aminoglycoside phosphotransferase (APT) family kinase protein